MKYEELLRYVHMIRQMETTVYEQQEAIKKLTETADSLGHNNTIYAPGKEETWFYFGENYPGYAFIVGVVAAIIVFIRNYEGGGFFDIIGSAVVGLLWAIPIGALGGVVIGLFFSLLGWGIRKLWDNKDYRGRKSDYKKEIQADNQRVAEELRQKQYILNEIELLKQKNADSMAKLNHYYSYNIIDQAYRHDIVAIYMFYHYLRTQQTFSLARDNATGDVGAYRLYQNDIMMGMIISKLDIIIEKLDEIAEIQREIVDAIYAVNANIDRLNDTVVKSSRRVENAINQQTAVETYNGQVMKRELEWGNTINWLNYVDNKKR